MAKDRVYHQSEIYHQIPMDTPVAGMYVFYLGDLALPITPSSLTISNQDRTETVFLANDEPFTIPHKDGPQTFSFEFRMPADGTVYPFMFDDATLDFIDSTDYLWNLKQAQKPIHFIVDRRNVGPTLDETVLLTDYSYTEDAEKGDDFIFQVKLINFHGQTNQELEALDTHGLILTKNARGWNR